MALAHKNRIKTQQPRGKSGWCTGCDRAKVRDGQRCPVCGHKETNRAKKISFIESDDFIEVEVSDIKFDGDFTIC